MHYTIDLSDKCCNDIEKKTKIATIANKVANLKRLAYFSFAVILAIAAILPTFQYGFGIVI